MLPRMPRGVMAYSTASLPVAAQRSVMVPPGSMRVGLAVNSVISSPLESEGVSAGGLPSAGGESDGVSDGVRVNVGVGVGDHDPGHG